MTVVIELAPAWADSFGAVGIMASVMFGLAAMLWAARGQ